MTQPLYVTAILEAVPGKEDQLFTLLNDALPAFQSEPGCVAYTLLRDIEHAGVFVTFEQWRDDAALQQHMQSDAMAAAKPALEQLLARPMRQIKLDAVPGSTV